MEIHLYTRRLEPARPVLLLFYYHMVLTSMPQTSGWTRPYMLRC